MKNFYVKQLNIQKFGSLNSQSGQATMEFVAILIGFVALMLGIIFVSGLSLSSNKMLMSARNNAERLARHSNYDAAAQGLEYLNWTKTKVKLYDNKSIDIPFGLNDEITRKDYNSIFDSKDALTNSLYSGDESLEIKKELKSTKYYDYKDWVGPNKFSPLSNNTVLNNDFFDAVTTSNALEAARLIQGEHDNDIALISTINSKHQQDASFNKSSNAAQALYDTFEKLVGVRLSKKKLDNSRTNRVYMPIVENNHDITNNNNNNDTEIE